MSSKQHIDFSRYIALGDSVTAGYKDGALFREGQLSSFPNLLACQFGCSFKQPLVHDDSVGIGFFENSRLVLKKQADCLNPQASYLAAHGDQSALIENCYATQGPFNNLGVPGAKVITMLAPGYGNSKLGPGNYNPFFSRFSSKPESASILEEAVALRPTFFTLFIGNNDALAYALSGGTSDTITPLEGPPGRGFESTFKMIVDSLISNGAKGAISNLPSLTSIPFFYTIRYNDFLLNKKRADSLNSEFHAGKVKFSEGLNAFLVEDVSEPGGLRQLNEGEFVSLDVMLDENRHDYLTGLKPLPKQYYLSAKQVKEIGAALGAYNSIIEKITKNANLAFVDTNDVLENMKADRTYNAETHEIEYKTGGFFSLDGLHINSLGHALLGNEFINAINATYGTGLAKINLTKSRERCND